MIEPGRYRHYKGTEYLVIGTGLHTETLEELVIYRDIHDETKIWVRPARMFTETVKMNNATCKRFVKITHQGGQEG